MKKWVTILEARDRVSGMLKRYVGDYVEAPSKELAQNWCDENKPYLTVTGELVEEQDEHDGSVVSNYENASLN